MVLVPKDGEGKKRTAEGGSQVAAEAGNCPEERSKRKEKKKKTARSKPQEMLPTRLFKSPRRERAVVEARTPLQWYQQSTQAYQRSNVYLHFTDLQLVLAERNDRTPQDTARITYQHERNLIEAEDLYVERETRGVVTPRNLMGPLGAAGPPLPGIAAGAILPAPRARAPPVTTDDRLIMTLRGRQGEMFSLGWASGGLTSTKFPDMFPDTGAAMFVVTNPTLTLEDRTAMPNARWRMKSIVLWGSYKFSSKEDCLKKLELLRRVQPGFTFQNIVKAMRYLAVDRMLGVTLGQQWLRTRVSKCNRLGMRYVRFEQGHRYRGLRCVWQLIFRPSLDLGHNRTCSVDEIYLCYGVLLDTIEDAVALLDAWHALTKNDGTANVPLMAIQSACQELFEPNGHVQRPEAHWDGIRQAVALAPIPGLTDPASQSIGSRHVARNYPDLQLPAVGGVNQTKPDPMQEM